MDRNAAASDLGEPLLGHDDGDDDEEEELQDSLSAPAASMFASPAVDTAQGAPASTSTANAAAATSAPSSTTGPTSFYGKVSPLATGQLFPSPRGIVDALPHPSRPCLLFADHDPLAAASHICLLEKEAETLAQAGALPAEPRLFAAVHVCVPLAGKGDPGSRILRKINKGGGSGANNSNSNLELPVLFHEGNIFQEGRAREINSDGVWWSTFACMLPEYIDGAIGRKHSLRPADAVGLYNMRLFIQRHSHLPALFHKLLTHPSATQRIRFSTQLLDLLKLINSDLTRFEGPFLCGEQFTLADICIFPIIERIVVVLSAYRSFWIPPSLTHLIRWYDAAADRPAVRVATADRGPDSLNAYCFERTRRNEYLVEVYEAHARRDVVLFERSIFAPHWS